MEASLLVSPKPCVSVFFFSIRGKSRRFLVAAAGHGKDLDTLSDGRGNNGQVLLSSKVLIARARSYLSSLVAATAMNGALQSLLPCDDASAAAALEPPPLYRAVAVLGDLDPATAKTVAGVAGPALSALGFLFILRIVMSWYPRLPVTKFPYVLAYAPTEPFLAVTRKVIPPLGGVDVTPVVWFGLVSFLNEILVGPQGLLVLLSQQR